MNKILRHEIDPSLVKNQIEAAVARNEERRIQAKKDLEQLQIKYNEDILKGNSKQWAKAPSKTIEEIDKFYDERSNREKFEYALVRVIEDPEKEGERFYLVYGNQEDAPKGTGPFISLDRAQKWFLNHGR